MADYESGELARRIWEALKRSGVELSTAHLNIIDVVFIEAAQHLRAADVLPCGHPLENLYNFRCRVCGKPAHR